MPAAPSTAADRRLGAEWVVAAAVALLLAGAVFFGGGSGSGSVPALGIAVAAFAVGALGAAALRLVALPLPDRAATVGLLAVAGLVVWTGLTMVWSIAGDRSWAAFDKGLVEAGYLLAGLVLGVLGTRTARTAALVLAAVLGAALVWALLGKAIPGLYPDGDRVARLRSPVDYPNGLALLADGALALGLWLGTGVSDRRARRVAGALLVYVAGLALVLTASRAGVLGAILAVGLWLALSPKRVEGLALGLAALVPAAAVGAWASTRAGLVDDAVGRAVRVDDAPLFAVAALAGAALAVGVAIALERLALTRERRRAVGRAAVAGAALGGVAALAALALAVGNPAAWAWDEFAGGSEDVNSPGRFTSLSSNHRSAWWGEAWQVFEAHRLAGAGAGTFAIARLRYRDDATAVTQPHSVPLQLLSGTGLVGLALGLAAVAALALAGVRSVQRLEGGELAAAHALVALPAVWLLHALVDYDLDFLAVTAPALLATGALAAAARPPARAPGWPLVAAAGAAALLTVGSVVSPELSSRALDDSLLALDEGRPDRAADDARRAESLNPL
ncbi:MAG TPA: O-antigen ligase family protein, partial [Gaiellaceae bacterium]|nr:O-antigen ligase family protein [Gaiellaceae bacterium]